MSSTAEVAGATQEAAGQTASAAKDEAAEVASAASSAAGDVAGTAKEQAGAVAADAVGQARDLFEQTKTQVGEQAGTAAAKLGESLKSLTEEIRAMGEGSSDGTGPAADLARSLAAKGESIADMLSKQGPGGIVSELRSFAGRSPGTFLLGALAAGVAAGRLTRGVKDVGSADTDAGTARTTTANPATKPAGSPVLPAAPSFTSAPAPVLPGRPAGQGL